jgi:aspartyl-tRNA(Asn)/glutamyl-tRNA(Gln) amidotransferase subunit C
MPLSQKEVDHIAALARLELTDEQKAQYRKQLSAILDYMAKLSALDLEDVPPTAGAGLTQMSLRVDETRPSMSLDALLANAPDAEDDQFKIPPVFE